MAARFANSVLFLTCSALLAACGGAPASNELRFDNDGNGQFSGSAGADWTAQEIRQRISGQICGNGPVEEFRVSVLPSAPEYKIYSGSCAATGSALAATGVGQNHIVTAPATSTTPQVSAVQNRATWDGSTPFVD